MTERNYNAEQKSIKTMNKQEKAVAKVVEAPTKKEEKVSEVKTEEKIENKKEESKAKKPIKVKRVKKEFAVFRGIGLPISRKYSIEICRYIKGKKIDDAIKDLEDAIQKKRAIPMRGEYAHQKGKGMAGGKYPKNASEDFIRILRSLKANASYNEIDNPIIVEAIANKATKVYGRFGRTEKKRTHLMLKAMGGKE
ncbi:MAG: uL22 family ribosomal protein [Nanoarchaeota archaeon]|nr:uL22 family ribosomal protein [Nanoarchaeota archaeon]